VFLKALALIGLSLTSAILYRLGGIGKPFNTKYRDFGVPAVGFLSMLIFSPYTSPWWVHFLSFGFLFASMTTYWKLGNKDVQWWNWLLTGFFYGVAYLPYCIYNSLWLGFAIRSTVLSVLVCLWSVAISKDWLEEGGRGFAVIVTLPLLFL